MRFPLVTSTVLITLIALFVFCSLHFSVVLHSSAGGLPRKLWRPPDGAAQIREFQSTLASSPGARVYCDVSRDAADTSMYRKRSGVDMAFPPLPRHRAPDSPEWNISLAICTVIKQERISDLKEWISYHRWLGVDKIHITEDVANISQELQEGLRDYLGSGLVELDSMGSIPKRGGRQLPGFANCFRKLRAQYTWVAFTDVDEYIMLLERGQGLKSLLEEFKYHPAVFMNWVTFGSSGRVNRTEEGGVLRWYQNCSPKPELTVKVIVNSYDLLFMWSNPHNFFYRGHMSAVSEDMEPITLTENSTCFIPNDCVTGKTQCMNTPSTRFIEVKAPKRITLLHYATKSFEEFDIKRHKGTANHVHKRGENYLKLVDRYANQTGGLCDRGIQAWAQCCSHLTK